ncbi:MAG: glyoxalase [Flammeovirgaceae bacterium]|nr:glyoxalase [Flammeovirgaceae bacterium]MBE63551.1 glyoxalase [Flammeovirgaceae bacterium]HCX24242.1 glyoxalase [Cytophagales bacterium]|tara:strand:- start:4422 stop:4796 length:375 start_codon:yes stop_codon:yes gene_type:complete
MKNPVGWFEIPVTNMDRAKQFYESIFKIEISVQDFGNLQMGWFPNDMDAPGASGTLIKNEAYVPSYEGTMIYFSVEEIDDVTPGIEPAGGKIINKKQSIGDYGFVAHFEDTEGNRVALHQVPDK